MERSSRQLLLLLATALSLVAPSVVRARGLRIKRVAISGQRTVPRAALERAVKGVIPRGRLSSTRRARVRVAVRRGLLAYLKKLGYLKSRVTVREFRPGRHTSFVVLRARVSEGVRHLVGALDVTGVGPKLRLAALRRVRLRSGQFLDAGDLAASQDRVATLFADRGHAFVVVRVLEKPHAGRTLVDVTFHVKPGPTATIGQVVVRGASRTAEVLVRRALILKVGSKYHRTRMRKALIRLRRSGAFKSARLSESRLGKRRVKLVVTVVESK